MCTPASLRQTSGEDVVTRGRPPHMHPYRFISTKCACLQQSSQGTPVLRSPIGEGFSHSAPQNPPRPRTTHSGAEGLGLEEQGLMGNHPTLDPHAPQPDMQPLANSVQCKHPGGQQLRHQGAAREAWGTRLDLVPWARQACAHASHEEGQARAGAATRTPVGQPLTFCPPSGTQHPDSCAPP